MTSSTSLASLHLERLTLALKRAGIPLGAGTFTAVFKVGMDSYKVPWYEWHDSILPKRDKDNGTHSLW